MIPLLSILQLFSTPGSGLSYHLACSSLDFLGIVIVKVCFFPAADFLLNSALGNQPNPNRKHTPPCSPVYGVYIRLRPPLVFASLQLLGQGQGGTAGGHRAGEGV